MKKHTTKWIAGIIIVIIVVLLIVSNVRTHKSDTIKIGYISAMTGPAAKYGAYEAGKLAMDDINKNGGINGKPLQVIFEDGKCDGATAVSAMNKLISVDKVDIVIGGHCSPESVAIAPVAEQNKVIMLASITTTPSLNNAGQYVFRTSPVSTIQSELTSQLAYKLGLRKFAVVYEQTAYATPIAESLKTDFEKLGGTVLVYEGVTPGTTDYRTVLTKVKNSGADALLLSPQSPDSALYMMQQAKALGIKAKIFGNDVTSNQVSINKNKDLFEGLIVTLPDFDRTNPKIFGFIKEYTDTYKAADLPYGVWTAETYDGVNIIADALKANGDDVNKIKTFLENDMNGYHGVSGTISIGKDHNGIRNYSLMIVKGGVVVSYNQ